jgi:hypothetical protein
VATVETPASFAGPSENFGDRQDRPEEDALRPMVLGPEDPYGVELEYLVDNYAAAAHRATREGNLLMPQIRAVVIQRLCDELRRLINLEKPSPENPLGQSIESRLQSGLQTFNERCQLQRENLLLMERIKVLNSIVDGMEIERSRLEAAHPTQRELDSLHIGARSRLELEAFNTQAVTLSLEFIGTHKRPVSEFPELYRFIRQALTQEDNHAETIEAANRR